MHLPSVLNYLLKRNNVQHVMLLSMQTTYFALTNLFFRIFKIVKVSSLVGRYSEIGCIVKSVKLCFPLTSRTIIYVYVNVILDFPITYRNASVLCQSECGCLHKTLNMVVFFVKSKENTYPKRRVFIQMYRVVPITK